MINSFNKWKDNNNLWKDNNNLLITKINVGNNMILIILLKIYFIMTGIISMEISLLILMVFNSHSFNNSGIKINLNFSMINRPKANSITKKMFIMNLSMNKNQKQIFNILIYHGHKRQILQQYASPFDKSISLYQLYLIVMFKTTIINYCL